MLPQENFSFLCVSRSLQVHHSIKNMLGGTVPPGLFELGRGHMPAPLVLTYTPVHNVWGGGGGSRSAPLCFELAWGEN